MTYNFVEANVGSGGAKFAVDEIAGWQFPLSKIAWGVEGVATPASAAAPLPVTDTNNPALLTTIPDNQVNAPPVRLVGQDIWACSFTNVIAAGIDAAYFTERAVGTGVGRSQAGGSLLITTGTSANAEYLARSNVSWRSSMTMRYKLTASQRIANQNFAVLLADKIGEGLSCTINSATSITIALPGHGYTSQNVGQFMCVGGISGAAGVPGRYAIASVVAGTSITFTVAGWPASGSCTVDLFGHSYIRNLYNGTSATAMLFDAQRKGWASGDTTATMNTTASPGHLAQVVNDGRSLYLSDSLTASATSPNVTTRASRFENTPDDNLDLYVYLWSYNGTSAPASTTAWTLGFVSVERFANLPVFIQGAKPQGSVNGLPVSGSININFINPGVNVIGDVGIQYRANATGAATPVSILSPATPAAASIKGSAGRLLGWQLQNSSTGVRSVKLFNATSVTLGTTSAAFEIDIPAGGRSEINLPGGIAFGTGIMWSVSSAKGLTDNTSTGLAANDVSGSVFYA